MEECSSGSKRKKRKTRKCLNEIRKKSRMNTNSASVTKNKEIGTKTNNNMAKVVGLNCNNNYITSNRLTLAIFPKAVRSETITRPLLAEIRHEPGNININNIVKSKCSMYPENKNTTYEKVDHAHSFNLSKNGTNMFSAEEEADEIVDNNGVDSENFHMKNSDVGRVAGSSSGRSAAESPARDVSPPSSPEPMSRLREQHAYRVYEQFVKNIPTFIQIHAPSLLKGDAMKKPKATLHSIYVEGRRRLAEVAEGEEATATATTSASAALNPRDYLRLWRARSPSASPPSCNSPSPPPAPRSPPEPPPPPRSVTQDTPEYTYYPHKLNQ